MGEPKGGPNIDQLLNSVPTLGIEPSTDAYKATVIPINYAGMVFLP